MHEQLIGREVFTNKEFFNKFGESYQGTIVEKCGRFSGDVQVKTEDGDVYLFDFDWLYFPPIVVSCDCSSCKKDGESDIVDALEHKWHVSKTFKVGDWVRTNALYEETYGVGTKSHPEIVIGKIVNIGPDFERATVSLHNGRSFSLCEGFLELIFGGKS